MLTDNDKTKEKTVDVPSKTTEVTAADHNESPLPATTPLNSQSLPISTDEDETLAGSEQGDAVEENPESNDNDLAKTAPLDQSMIEQAEQAALPPIQVNSGKPSYEPSIHFAQRCDVGAIRPRNEDSSFAFVSQGGGQQPLLPFALCLVADGMGGHHAGHEASRLVSREVVNHVMSRIFLPLIQGKPAEQSIQEVMEDAVREANRALYTPDPEKEGGTTLTAAVIIGRRMFLVHAGDSRAYLLQNNELKILTKDHSVVQRLQDAGHITAEEAEKHPHRHLLYKAITGGEVDLDEDTYSLPKQGKLMICSDGLWGSLTDAQLQEVLENETLSLQAQADILIKKAIEAGSTDNVTAVIAEFRL